MEDHREEAATDTQQSNLPPTDRRPWQYSLRTLFAVTTLVAITFSLLFASPGWIRALGCVCLVTALPLLLTLMLIHGSSYARTFSLGALFPSGVYLLAITFTLGYLTLILIMDEPGVQFVDFEEFGHWPAFFLALDLVLSVVFGLVAVSIRWWVESPQPRQQPTTIE